jgi:hypothetical protein
MVFAAARAYGDGLILSLTVPWVIAQGNDAPSAALPLSSQPSSPLTYGITRHPVQTGQRVLLALGAPVLEELASSSRLLDERCER